MSAYGHLDVPLADGRHLRVRRSPGRGRPAVLLHGLLDDAAGWTRVMERSTHRCLAFDLPGFGGSSAPTRPRSGAVATALAERSPDVDALALLAPAGFGPIRLVTLAALPGVKHALQAALPLGLVNPLVVTAAYTTLVAHGKLPSGEPVAHAGGVQAAFPQARVEVWRGMGHHPQRERPEALDRFLTKVLWNSRPRAAAVPRRRVSPARATGVQNAA